MSARSARAWVRLSRGRICLSRSMGSAGSVSSPRKWVSLGFNRTEHAKCTECYQARRPFGSGWCRRQGSIMAGRCGYVLDLQPLPAPTPPSFLLCFALASLLPTPPSTHPTNSPMRKSSTKRFPATWPHALSLASEGEPAACGAAMGNVLVANEAMGMKPWRYCSVWVSAFGLREPP